MDNQKEITLNVTAHREGYYLYKTLESVLAGYNFATEKGVEGIEINIHLDSPDDLTLDIARKFGRARPYVKIYENIFGDSSLSRNFLIEKSLGKYILFLDGDDFFTKNFIYDAYRLSEHYGKPTVFAAEYIVDFNGAIASNVYKVESTVQNPHRKTSIFENNLYISQNFVHSDIYKSIKYEPNAGGYGYEDWHWNTKIIANGHDFQVVPNTMFFYRRKDGAASLLNIHKAGVLRPTPLFKPELFRSLDHVRYLGVDTDEEDSHMCVEQIPKNKVRILGVKLLTRITTKESVGYRFIRGQYNAFQQLAAPVIHRVRNYPRRSTASVFQGIVVPVEQERILTDEHLRYWKELNNIEPVLRPTKELVRSLNLFKYADEHLLASTYYDFCVDYGLNGFDDIIFLPWIVKGGADLAMIDLVMSLSSSNRKVLVVTTNGVDSVWKHKIEAIPNATILESHHYFNKLDHINFKLFFLRVIQNWDIQTVTIMNSAIGFELLEKYGKYIKGHCRVIVHNYAIPIDGEGMFVEAFSAFPGSLEFVDGIVTDSQTHADLINLIYGYKKNKIYKIPLSMSENLQTKKSGVTKKILFANRIAREKQPQVAIEIAKKLLSMGVKMDIYGTKDDAFCNEINFDQLIEETDNVSFEGSFDGVENLDFDEYDICLVPSLYEGIPRIVLESIKANLFIICGKVGGLPEVVIEKDNGFLIEDTRSTDEYVKKIKQYYQDASLQDLTRRRNASLRIVKQHSSETHTRYIKKVYNL